MKKEKGQKKRSGKKKIIIIFSILGVIVIAGVAFVISQRNNIAAARYLLNYSSDEISEKLAENEQRILDALDEHVPVRVPDLTDEEKELMASDDLTIEDAVSLLVERAAATEVSINQASLDNPDDPSDEFLDEGPSAPLDTTFAEQGHLPDADVPPDNFDSDETGVLTEYDESADVIIGLVAEVYVLRAYFTSRLDQLFSSAVSEYRALSEEEQSSMGMDIASKYIDLAFGLERECDGLMDDLVARLRAELQKTGGDSSFVNDIMSGYSEEKSLKKAYYLSLYSSYSA